MWDKGKQTKQKLGEEKPLGRPRCGLPVFHTEGGDTLEQVAQGSCVCPFPGDIQGQAGCVSGQPGLVVGNPAYSRGIETR